MGWPGLTGPLQARFGVNTGEALVRLDVDPASGRGLPHRRRREHRRPARRRPLRPGCRRRATHRELHSRPVSSTRLLSPSTRRARPSLCLPGSVKAASRRTGLRTSGESATAVRRPTAELQVLEEALESAQARRSAQYRTPRGRAGHRQEPARPRVRQRASTAPRPLRLAAGAVPCLRRGCHVLAPRRDPEGPRRHPRLRRGRRRSRRSWRRCCRRATTDPGSVSVSGRCSVSRLRRPSGRRASPPGPSSSPPSHGIVPTVLVVEDPHWADEAMLAFLEHLVKQELEVPLLVLVTTRPELLRETPGDARGVPKTRRPID